MERGVDVILPWVRLDTAFGDNYVYCHSVPLDVADRNLIGALSQIARAHGGRPSHEGAPL